MGAAPEDPEDPGGWLDRLASGAVPWTSRLDVRLTAIVTLAVAFSCLALSTVRQAVRAVIDALVADPGQQEQVRVPAAEVLFDVLFFVTIGLITGIAIRRLVTDRLRSMVEVLRETTTLEPDVPYPFAAHAPDEIGRLAAAMNLMHARIHALVGSLEGRDRGRRAWLSRVSHDLRTPLTALEACLNRAREQAGELPPSDAVERLKEALHVARLDTDRFDALAADLLAVAQLDGKDFELVREPVLPTELVRRVSTSLKLLAEDLGRTIRVEVTREDLPELVADGHQLSRALENILRNALRHGEGDVVVRVAASNGDVVFEVQDDGPGFPLSGDGTVDFSSLAASPGRRDSTGIGLLVARRVIEAHGGHIEADNAPDAGAVVRLHVPIPDAEDAPTH